MDNIQKFMTMETSKKDRIINAAMHEFRYGYKKASTDAIVKQAGISKGLLFHYFGSKERLYTFLVNYALDVMNSEYLNMINFENNDLLEVMWQFALLKRDISLQHPFLEEFELGLYTHKRDFPNKEIDKLILEKQVYLFEQFHEKCDTSLFVDDIDQEKAILIICWAMDGFFSTKEAFGDDYDEFLETLKSYLGIFRQRFYK